MIFGLYDLSDGSNFLAHEYEIANPKAKNSDGHKRNQMG
jgi:hypothetical protein